MTLQRPFPVSNPLSLLIAFSISLYITPKINSSITFNISPNITPLPPKYNSSQRESEGGGERESQSAGFNS